MTGARIDWQKLLVSIHFSAFNSMIFIRFAFLLALAAEVNFRRAHVRLFDKLNPVVYPFCILISIAFQLSDLIYVKNYMKFGDCSCFYAPYAFAEVCLDMDRYQRLVPLLEGTAIRFMFLNVFLSTYLFGYTFRQAWLKNGGKAEKEDKDNPSQRSLWIYLMVLAINVSAVIERYWFFGDLQNFDMSRKFVENTGLSCFWCRTIGSTTLHVLLSLFSFGFLMIKQD